MKNLHTPLFVGSGFTSRPCRANIVKEMEGDVKRYRGNIEPLITENQLIKLSTVPEYRKLDWEESRVQ